VPEGKATNGADDWCTLDLRDLDLGGSGPVYLDDPFIENGRSEDILIGGAKTESYESSISLIQPRLSRRIHSAGQT